MLSSKQKYEISFVGAPVTGIDL